MNIWLIGCCIIYDACMIYCLVVIFNGSYCANIIRKMLFFPSRIVNTPRQQCVLVYPPIEQYMFSPQLNFRVYNSKKINFFRVCI